MENIDYICNRCEGTGTLDANNDFVDYICPKCLGTGKLNWIQNIFGKQPKFHSIIFDPSTYSEISEEFIKKASEELAIDIDKQILEYYLNTSNNTTNMRELYGYEVKHGERIYCSGI